MTDEELGEDSFNSKKVLYKSSTDKRSYIDGFLAGLEAGRPKWHKVDDKDLPKNTNLVLVQTVNGNTTLGIYYANAWREICNYKELTGIYVWCEIPKFKEENNGKM